MITPKAEVVSPLTVLKRSAGWLVGVALALSCLGYTYTLYIPSSSTISVGGAGRPRAGELTFVLLKVRILRSHHNAQLVAAHPGTELAQDYLLPEMRADWWRNNMHPGEFPKQAATIAKLANKPNSTLCQSVSATFYAHLPELFHVILGRSHGFIPSLGIKTWTKGRSPDTIPWFQDTYENIKCDLVGRSPDTIPWFQDTYDNITCDLTAVDEDPSMALTDFINSIKMTKIGGKILANEITPDAPQFKVAWDQIVEAGYIKEPVCEQDSISGGKGRSWCYGTVARNSGSLDQDVVWPEDNAQISGLDKLMGLSHIEPAKGRHLTGGMWRKPQLISSDDSAVLGLYVTPQRQLLDLKPHLRSPSVHFHIPRARLFKRVAN
eukprot:gene25823-11498_t